MRMRTTLAAATLLAVGALLGWLAASGRLTPTTRAQDKPAAGDKGQGQPESPEMAAVRKSAEAFIQAFNKGDAKAVAAFWTKDGEYIGPDEEPIRGREVIEKTYAEFFKNNPKATLEVDVQSVRMFGRQAALAEGRVKVRLPASKEPAESRFSVLYVREDDGWRMASVREVVPDPTDLTLKDVEWLLGDWAAKSDDAEARLSYAWDEDKVFVRGRYSLKRGGKVVSSGTQLIGKDPNGGLRSWQFDANGSFGEWAWLRDEGRVLIEAVGTLPNGSETTAVNIVIPLGKDAFTWQSVERTAAGSPLPDTPPLKVTRVKTEK